MRKIYLAFFLFIICSQAYATHIIGGEIYYECLGNNNYRITLKVYRDCYNGIPELDNPAHLTIFDNFGNVIRTEDFFDPVKKIVPPVINNPCLVVPPNVCVEEGVYTKIITLPFIAGGYHLSYQRCCRNNSILNIIDPGGSGSTYTTQINDVALQQCNSNPHFKNFPPVALCVNDPLVFDHSAIDPNGDQLVYELCDPFLGKQDGDPVPEVTDPPPYFFVSWNSPYSASFPMAANPAISIDPTTGLLTGTPTQVGQYVVGVCVKEYKNGVLISVNKRDFQFNVVQCEPSTAAIPSQQLFCDGFTVSFGNNSINANSYFWNFGDPNSTTDFSTQTSPTYTYQDSGVYTIMLIASPGLQCADTAYSTFEVYPLLKPAFTAPSRQCFKNNKFDFSAGGAFTTDAVFSWSFGANATPSTSTLKDPKNISFTNPGNHVVNLTVSQYGCTKTVSQIINIVAQPKSIIAPQVQDCKGLIVIFASNSTNATAYYWDFGDPGSTTDNSTLANPTYTYSTAGTFKVMLIAKNENMCFDTSYAFFTVNPIPKPSFAAQLPQCLKGNLFSFTADGIFSTGSTFEWIFGTSVSPQITSEQNPSNVIFTASGKFPVTLTVTSFGCSGTYTDTIEILKNPIANAPQTQFCNGLTVFFDNWSNNSTTYFWNFGDPTTTNDFSTLFQPNYTYPDSGVYTVTLITSNQGACYDTATTNFYVYPLLKPAIETDNNQCLVNNSFDFYAKGSYGTEAIFSWDFTSSASTQFSTLKDPKDIVFSALGTYTVSLSISENGCIKTATHVVTIYPMPAVEVYTGTPHDDCMPLPVQFIHASPTSNTLFYTWNFGDGSTSQENNPVHIYNTPGTFDINLQIITVTENGCRDTFYFYEPQQINVNPLPTAEFTVDSTSVSIFNPLITVTDQSFDRTLCYLFFGDGDSTNICTETHKYNKPGSYIISQIVENEFGCRDTFKVNVEVRHEYRFFIPNTFTPNGDGMNDIFKPVIMGVEEYTFMIFDRWGELIFETNDPEAGWNGVYKGDLCQMEVYVYKLNFKDLVKNAEHTFVGHVNLIR